MQLAVHKRIVDGVIATLDGNVHSTGCPKIRGATQWGNVNSCYKIMGEIIKHSIPLRFEDMEVQKVQL
jgi:hypothetical protein